jgi:hypothetical protein
VHFYFKDIHARFCGWKYLPQIKIPKLLLDTIYKLWKIMVILVTQCGCQCSVQLLSANLWPLAEDHNWSVIWFPEHHTDFTKRINSTLALALALALVLVSPTFFSYTRVLRADRGTENAKISFLHPFLRHQSTNGHDSSAENMFRYGRSVHNQVAQTMNEQHLCKCRVERFWGNVRQWCSTFWIDFFKVQLHAACGDVCIPLPFSP